MADTGIGLVPTPKAGDNTKFLRADGIWADASTDATFLCANGFWKRGNKKDYFLRGDAAWAQMTLSINLEVTRGLYASYDAYTYYGMFYFDFILENNSNIDAVDVDIKLILDQSFGITSAMSSGSSGFYFGDSSGIIQLDSFGSNTSANVSYTLDVSGAKVGTHPLAIEITGKNIEPISLSSIVTVFD